MVDKRINRQEALSRVANIARSREARAASEHRKCSDTLARSKAQLEQLDRFRAEYQARMQSMMADRSDPRRIQQYQRFLDGLASAVKHQNDLVIQAGRDAQHSWDALRQSSIRRASLDRLLQHRSSETARQLNSLEQRLSDESHSHHRSRD